MSVPCTLAPALHMHSLQHYQHPPEWYICYNQGTSREHIVMIKSRQFTLMFTFGIIHSMGLAYLLGCSASDSSVFCYFDLLVQLSFSFRHCWCHMWIKLLPQASCYSWGNFSSQVLFLLLQCCLFTTIQEKEQFSLKSAFVVIWNIFHGYSTPSPPRQGACYLQ